MGSVRRFLRTRSGGGGARRSIIAATAVVFLLFAIFETRLPRFSNSSSLSGNIIFFLLINLNLILLVLLVFLVTRNLVKLVFERRRGIFGSRLRTRLALAFVGLHARSRPSLLFFVAEGFLSAAFENWFNVRVESSLKGSLGRGAELLPVRRQQRAALRPRDRAAGRPSAACGAPAGAASCRRFVAAASAAS